ncbi:MAG: peptidase M48, partial [Bacteroidota bacterium]
MLLKIWFPSLCLVLMLGISGCKSGGLGGINFFSVEDDIALGKQVSQQIESDPKQFPILPERGNEEVYRYIRGITNKILNTGKVQHRDKFAWQVKIIDDPNTLNAFATPGGYIYVYT